MLERLAEVVSSVQDQMKRIQEIKDKLLQEGDILDRNIEDFSAIQAILEKEYQDNQERIESLDRVLQELENALYDLDEAAEYVEEESSTEEEKEDIVKLEISGEELEKLIATEKAIEDEVDQMGIIPF